MYNGEVCIRYPMSTGSIYVKSVTVEDNYSSNIKNYVHFPDKSQYYNVFLDNVFTELKRHLQRIHFKIILNLILLKFILKICLIKKK